MREWDCKFTGLRDGKTETQRVVVYAPNDRDAARDECRRAASTYGYRDVHVDKLVNRGTSNHVEVRHPAPFAKTESGKKRRYGRKHRLTMKERITC